MRTRHPVAGTRCAHDAGGDGERNDGIRFAASLEIVVPPPQQPRMPRDRSRPRDSPTDVQVRVLVTLQSSPETRLPRAPTAESAIVPTSIERGRRCAERFAHDVEEDDREHTRSPARPESRCADIRLLRGGDGRPANRSERARKPSAPRPRACALRRREALGTGDQASHRLDEHEHEGDAENERQPPADRRSVTRFRAPRAHAVIVRHRATPIRAPAVGGRARPGDS